MYFFLFKPKPGKTPYEWDFRCHLKGLAFVSNSLQNLWNLKLAEVLLETLAFESPSFHKTFCFKSKKKHVWQSILLKLAVAQMGVIVKYMVTAMQGSNVALWINAVQLYLSGAFNNRNSRKQFYRLSGIKLPVCENMETVAKTVKN